MKYLCFIVAVLFALHVVYGLEGHKPNDEVQLSNQAYDKKSVALGNLPMESEKKADPINHKNAESSHHHKSGSHDTHHHKSSNHLKKNFGHPHRKSNPAEDAMIMNSGHELEKRYQMTGKKLDHGEKRRIYRAVKKAEDRIHEIMGKKKGKKAAMKSEKQRGKSIKQKGKKNKKERKQRKNSKTDVTSDVKQ